MANHVLLQSLKIKDEAGQTYTAACIRTSNDHLIILPKAVNVAAITLEILLAEVSQNLAFSRLSGGPFLGGGLITKPNNVIEKKMPSCFIVR